MSRNWRNRLNHNSPMKKFSRLLVRVGLPALLLTAGAAQAHQFWYEGKGEQLTFRYGELHLNLHEVSPGGLDRMVKLETTWYSPKGETPVALTKRADRLDLDPGVRPAATDSLVSVDLEYPMHDISRDGKTLHNFWVPATRWVGDFSAREPVLTLDIVPTGKRHGDAVEFQVTYLGEPLAGEELKVSVPSGWVRPVISDIEGKFHVALPWSGDYSVNLYFVDEVEGVRKLEGRPDGAYQREGYNTTLSVHVAQALAPLPVADKTLPASVLLEQGIAPPKHR